MGLSNAEFENILTDTSKCIEGDISWQLDEDHSPCVDFRAEVTSSPGWPLFVRGSLNRLIGAVSFVLILKTVGRIYALDLGKDHHNPQCDFVGDCHKHRWTERFRDKEAYCPQDITADPANPTEVWRQFCEEARISHRGVLHAVPDAQRELF